MTYLLALDQGTSSARSIVFDETGRTVAMAQGQKQSRFVAWSFLAPEAP